MRFTLTIECDNAAFGDGPYDRAAEIARILRDHAEAMDMGQVSQPRVLRDANGNTVGAAKFVRTRAKVRD